MQKTDNSMDLALSREGLFFAVKTPQGIRLTRDGSFTTDDEGKLITKQGYEVLSEDYQNGGGISFNSADTIVKIDKNGQIYTNLPNSLTMGAGSKLFIAQPDNMKALKKEGDNLYSYENIQELQNAEQSGAVVQGFVEKSNVNAVKMMTQMIETNRLVGMYQKAMSSQMDDMNNLAISKIAAKA
jgi:flagellar basal-body rod protein FlgG